MQDELQQAEKVTVNGKQVKSNSIFLSVVDWIDS